MRSEAFTPMACERAETLIDSSIRITFLCSARSVTCVFCPFLVGFFFLPRIGTKERSATAACSRSFGVSDLTASSAGRPPTPRRFLSLETSMNSRSRPRLPGTTLSSRTSPSARGPGAAGYWPRAEVGGVTRRTGEVGLEITTACVEVGRMLRGSGRWTAGGGATVPGRATGACGRGSVRRTVGRRVGDGCARSGGVGDGREVRGGLHRRACLGRRRLGPRGLLLRTLGGHGSLALGDRLDLALGGGAPPPARTPPRPRTRARGAAARRRPEPARRGRACAPRSPGRWGAERRPWASSRRRCARRRTATGLPRARRSGSSRRSPGRGASRRAPGSRARSPHP